MALFNYKPQSFFSSVFIKPFNSFLSYCSQLFKPKLITKKDDSKHYDESNNSSIKMKVLFTSSHDRYLHNMRKRISQIESKLDNYKRERAEEKHFSKKKEEKSFVSNILNRVNIFKPELQIFRHKSMQEILDAASKDKNNSYSRTFRR
jgi:chromosome condensin MukBEF ATPase and DNA-binding subunit MukB